MHVNVTSIIFFRLSHPDEGALELSQSKKRTKLCSVAGIESHFQMTVLHWQTLLNGFCGPNAAA